LSVTAQHIEFANGVEKVKKLSNILFYLSSTHCMKQRHLKFQST